MPYAALESASATAMEHGWQGGVCALVMTTQDGLLQVYAGLTNLLFPDRQL